MTTLTNKPLLLVGSLPLGSADAVFRTCAEAIGSYVASLPDGETGPRELWISYLARDIYNGHPDIETIHALEPNRPPDVMGGTNKWSFQPRPGKTPHLELGYADFALESYEVFTAHKKSGLIPADVRFQVCFPGTGSAFMSFFDDARDWPTMAAAYEDGVKRDLQAILARVPAKELAIQYDICTELRDMQGALRHSPDRSTKFEETIEATARLSAMVPKDALLGLHWCYGTFGGWPMVRIENLDLCTKLTNAAVDAISRRVDYVHMPVLRHVGDSYFESARNLRKNGPLVYLGLIHHTDGMEGFRERIKVARRHMPESFGVAAVCGFGRLGPKETADALALHREIGKELVGAR